MEEQNQNPQPNIEPVSQSNQNQSNQEKPYELEPNVEAALSYFLTPFSGIAIYVMEKENKFVRFHAFQSTLFGITALAAYGISTILTAILIGFFLIPIVSMASLLFWLLLMYKAYNKEEYELPFLGKIARDAVSK
jgi:uncharacterized membrane protein